jgi:hypothetical protein
MRADHAIIPIMTTKQSDDEYTPEETAKRMENAIRRAFNTPPQPRTKPKAKSSQKKGKKV